jgi:hypothetical protein
MFNKNICIKKTYVYTHTHTHTPTHLSKEGAPKNKGTIESRVSARRSSLYCHLYICIGLLCACVCVAAEDQVNAALGGGALEEKELKDVLAILRDSRRCLCVCYMYI